MQNAEIIVGDEVKFCDNFTDKTHQLIVAAIRHIDGEIFYDLSVDGEAFTGYRVRSKLLEKV